jgi:hypothetical protein
VCIYIFTTFFAL